MTAAEANRSFSRILRGVREGHTYVVTSHGKAVARIVPPAQKSTRPSPALEALFARLEQQAVVNAAPWTRAELYEDDFEGER